MFKIVINIEEGSPKMKLILASQSPRRRELLKGMGYVFDVKPSDTKENFDGTLGLDKALMKVAREKAKQVFEQNPNDVVIAADTIVCADDKVFGKPTDKQEAFDTLKSFSGNWHQVKTGVVVMAKHYVIEHVETTDVCFKDLSDDQILAYVNQETCLDKAGSYGIQDTDFVSKVKGSYSNVIGLPIMVADKMLKFLQYDPDIQI